MQNGRQWWDQCRLRADQLRERIVCAHSRKVLPVGQYSSIRSGCPLSMRRWACRGLLMGRDSSIVTLGDGVRL